MSTSIAASVDDLSCSIAFFFCNPYSNQIYNFTYTCIGTSQASVCTAKWGIFLGISRNLVESILNLVGDKCFILE